MTTEEITGPLIPLRDYLDGSLPDWLPQLVEADENDLLDHLFVVRQTTSETPGGSIYDFTLAVDKEIALRIPGIEPFYFFIGSNTEGLLFLPAKLTLEPTFTFAFTTRLGLRFEPTFLKPADPAQAHVELTLDAYLSIDENLNLGISFPGGLSLERCYIGETGIAATFNNLYIDLARDSTATDLILEAGYDDTFVGIFVEEAILELPDDLAEAFPESIRLENAAIGSGGLSGSVSLEWTPAHQGSIADMPFELASFNLVFEHNIPVLCAIQGSLTVPFFEQPVDIALGIGAGGEIFGSLSAQNNLAALNLPDVLEFKLSGLGIESGDEGFTLLLSGALLLEAGSPALEWPEIELQELRIAPGGEVSLPDGWIDLQQPAAMNLYGFRLEISRIGMGNEDDGRRWVGLSAGVHLVEMLPTGASVEGLRVLWDPSGGRDIELTLQGVGLELTVPGVMHLRGDVSLVKEEDEFFFAGSVLLELETLGITLDAAVKIGRNQALGFNYVYIYLSLELPVGIPLWATGAAIYGFSGLYGMNVAPDVSGGDWYGWYAASPAFNIIDDSKWAGQQESSAFGAGIVIGTLFDAGWVVSSKSLLAILLPGPVLMFHGKADIMKLPPGLSEPDEEGAFNALAVLDANAGNFLMNIDAGWSVQKIIEIAANAESYFDFGSPANWHLYLGLKEPEKRRIRAYVISLFNADAYFMVDNAGIETGFGVTFGDDWKFGPVKVVLKSWIEAGAELTWQPLQLTGSLSMGGEFAVKVALFSAGIAAEATLSGKAPRLYWVKGMLEIRINLPTPLEDLKENIALEWKQDEPPALEDPFRSFGLDHLKVTEAWQPHKSGAALQPTSSQYAPGPLIPLDARPVLVFDRSVRDLSGLNNAHAAYIGSTQIGEHTFDYELLEISLEYWPKAGATTWKPVPPEDLFGTWVAELDGSGDPAASKLQLWTKTPFAFTRRTSRVYQDWFLANFPGWPCGSAPEPTQVCVDWKDETPNKPWGEMFFHKGLFFASDFPTFTQAAPRTTPCRIDGETALAFAYRLWIWFPEPVRTVDLCIEDEDNIEFVRAYSGGQVVQELTGVMHQVHLEARGIEWVEIISPSDDTFLASVCYTTEAEAAIYEWETENAERIAASESIWSSEEEIFGPETYYRLKARVKTIRRGRGDDAENEYTHYAYFHTSGPPALTPAWALPAPAGGQNPGSMEVGAYPSGGKLADLVEYVWRTIPGSGRVAVFRAYDLGVEFNENYVEQMYGADMVIQLRDTNDQPVRDEEGVEVRFANQWEDLPVVELSDTEITYVSQVKNCGEAWAAAYPPDRRVTSSAGVLLEEDFAGGLSAGWREPGEESSSIESNWTIGGGQLKRVAPVGSLGALLVAGDPGWGDYALEAELSDEGDEVGLVFRYTDDDQERYYRLRLDAGGRYLERFEGGEVTVLWQDSRTYTPTTGQVLAVQCLGARLRGQLGAELLFDLEDGAAFLNGQVGLYTNGTAAFAHFLVRSWPGGALKANTFYTAELRASFPLYQAAAWPADPDGDGWLALSEANKRMLFIGRPEWDNYRLEASIAIGAGESAGLMVRFQAEPGGQAFECYRLLLNPGSQVLQLARLEGSYDPASLTYSVSSRTRLWECGPGCGVDFTLAEFDLALTCIGSELTIEVNGQEVGKIEDNALASGPAGLYHQGSSQPNFSDMVVRSAPRQTVHRWSFATSAYPGLVELVDSFSGVIYEETCNLGASAFAGLASAASSAVAAAQNALQQARDALESSTAEEAASERAVVAAAVEELYGACAAQFDELYTALFATDYRPFPAEVELSEVLGSGGRYALLFEFPEPLDWARIAVRVRRKTGGGEYVDIAVPTSLFWNADGTRAFLLRNDGDPIGSGEFEIQISYELTTVEGPTLRRSGSTLPEAARMRFALEG